MISGKSDRIQIQSWLERELELLRYRISSSIKSLPEFQTVDSANEFAHPPPDTFIHANREQYFTLILGDYGGDEIVRTAFMLAYAAQFVPEYLDELHCRDSITDRPLTVFGVFFDGNQALLRVTWQTVAFLCRKKSGEVIEFLPYTHPGHWLYRSRLLNYPESSVNFPLHIPLLLDIRTLQPIFYPDEVDDFRLQELAAKLLLTPLEWEDLVLTYQTATELDLVHRWLECRHQSQSAPIFRKYLGTGFRVLFEGPPGTGKSLTAALLGKRHNCPVYRVDLSLIVSKWIGETEKNLAHIFDLAEHQNWILFFDEAEALFARRTEVHSSNDRHANQLVGYLLQRIEHFDGTIVMATNFKDSIDRAFTRRFQCIVHFPEPDISSRLLLWKSVLRDLTQLSENLDLNDLAREYSLTGAEIRNIVQKLILRTWNGDNFEGADLAVLETIIEAELKKSGKVSF